MQTAETMAYILEHSESKLLFVGKLDPVWEIMKQGVPAELPKVSFPLSPENSDTKWDEIIAEYEPVPDPADPAAEEMATIIYTSGSTGMPKGGMHDFGTTLTCSNGIMKVIDATAEDRYLSYLPLAHGMEHWLGECLILRTSLHVYYSESLATFVQDLQRSRPTLFMSVPRLWMKFQLGIFQKLPPKKLAMLLRIPILSGIVRKKILKELIAWYRDLGLELLEGYGMTENFNYSHLTQPGRSKPGHVGPPYEDVECRIAEDGEIQVNGPGSVMGYFKMPAETEEAFTEDGWLKTGDRGVIDDENKPILWPS